MCEALRKWDSQTRLDLVISEGDPPQEVKCGALGK
jgi:hypothetical protein